MNLKESQTTEFKLLWKDDFLKTVSAFANTDGGQIYIGIDDQGKVKGVNNINQLLETLPIKINNRLGIIIDAILHKEVLEYIEIRVNKVQSPVSVSGKFYQRSGSNTIELNGSNLSNFLLKKYGETWDNMCVEEFTLDEVNLETIEKFKRLAKDRVPDIDQEKDLKQLLKKLNLYQGKYLKRAAILLFAKDPQQYYIQSHSKIGRFLTETDIQTSNIIEGNLIDQVDKILDILRVKYLKAYISFEGVHRREKLEYPYPAPREAIINALIHRDYTNTSNLQIKVYNDKLVMYNGATLPSELPIEKFTEPHQSLPHNPIISNVFYKAGLIENWGRGTIDIINNCVKQGLPKPTFEYVFTALRTTFYKKDRADNSGGTNVGINVGVNVGVNELYDFILEYQPVSIKTLINTFDSVTQRTVERWLKQLKDKNQIEFKGAPKTGGYYVK